MQFNSTANTHDSLVHYVLHLLGGITTTDYPLADMSRATNTAKSSLALRIWENSDGWDFDDTGNTGTPSADQNLVDDQSEYTIPTGALEITEVDIKQTNGKFRRMRLIDESNVDVAIDDFQTDKGNPFWYRLFDDKIVLYPAPDANVVTTSNGLRVYMNREVNDFDATTTTTEVGFTQPGDKVVAYMVAEEWAEIFKPDTAQRIMNKRIELENVFLSHISNRSKSEPIRMMPRVFNSE